MLLPPLTPFPNSAGLADPCGQRWHLFSGAQASAWHGAGSDRHRQAKGLVRWRPGSHGHKGGRHSHRGLGDRTGTGCGWRERTNPQPQEQQARRAPRETPRAERIGGRGMAGAGRRGTVQSSRHIFHSPRESWYHEPLWFCKLWVRERKRGVSEVIHPQSPALQVQGETLNNSRSPSGEGQVGAGGRRGLDQGQHLPAGELDGRRQARPSPPRKPGTRGHALPGSRGLPAPSGSLRPTRPPRGAPGRDTH